MYNTSPNDPHPSGVSKSISRAYELTYIE